MDTRISTDGLRNIADVDFKEALRSGGLFRTSNGTVQITPASQSPGGKTRITESIVKRTALGDKAASPGDAIEFESRKEAMQYLREHPGESATVVKEYEEVGRAEAWLERNASAPSGDAELPLEMPPLDEEPPAEDEAVSGLPGFAFCTPEQRKAIGERYRQLSDGVDEDDEDELDNIEAIIVAECQEMVMDYLMEEISGWESLPKEQQDGIKKQLYKQMVVGDDKESIMGKYQKMVTGYQGQENEALRLMEEMGKQVDVESFTPDQRQEFKHELLAMLKSGDGKIDGKIDGVKEHAVRCLMESVNVMLGKAQKELDACFFTFELKSSTQEHACRMLGEGGKLDDVMKECLKMVVDPIADSLMGEVDLGSCTLDEQQAIKNRARQIIESYVQRTGGEGVGVRRSVVTECEAMAVSYRNEKISYLNEKIYGLESFGYYSLGQQTEIKGYVRQLLAENKSLEEVVVACQEKLNGYGSPPPMRAATIDLMREIEAMENFDSCTPEQQAHIKEHARQMFTGGYKAESTLAVCKYIALLYGANVGESLPESIQEGGDVSGIVEAVERLKKFMKANGGDYGVIDHYYDSQMGSSEGQAGRAMQYHWLTQCQDADNMENNYYFGGHEPVPEGKAKRKDLPKGEKRGKYLIYLNGAPKIYTPDELKAKLERVCEKYCGGDQEKYVRTVTMHRAFVAIALEKMDFPGKDPVSHTFTAYRGVNREALCGAYSDYKAASEAGHATIKHTMGESVSIRSPLGAHNDSGTDTHTFDVPFARVVAPYCLHLFAEGTSYGSKAGPNAFWTQREFVCNLQGLEARVKQNH